MRLAITFVLVGVAVGLVGVAQGGEWVTSRGEFCIDECKFRGDGNYFYWCHTVDGQSKVYRPNHNEFWENDETGEQVDKHKRWDYCTPGRIIKDEDKEDQEDEEDGGSRPNHGGRGKREVPNHGGREKMEVTNRGGRMKREEDPSQARNASANGNQGGNWGNNQGNQGGQGGNWGNNQGGNNQGNQEGGRWGNDGRDVTHTALYPQTECIGECYSSGGRSICNTNTDHPLAQGVAGNKWFYCSPNVKLRREQISSEKQLWCTGPCSRIGGDHYTCPTMFGRDKCSPDEGYNSKGDKCHKPCQLQEGGFIQTSYYFCYMDNQQSQYENCGYHGVEQALKHSLEFTENSGTPSVCADFCKWNDIEEKDYKSCNTVRWNWNSTSRESRLSKTWDYCEGYHAPPMSGTTIAIVIGCIVGVIVIAVVVSWSIKRAGYRRTDTSDPA